MVVVSLPSIDTVVVSSLSAGGLDLVAKSCGHDSLAFLGLVVSFEERPAGVARQLLGAICAVDASAQVFSLDGGNLFTV